MNNFTDRGISLTGKVIGARDPIVYAELLGGAVGNFVTIRSKHSQKPPLTARIVAFEQETCMLSPLGSFEEIRIGDEVEVSSGNNGICIPVDPLGCILDAECTVLYREVIDLSGGRTVTLPFLKSPPSPLARSAAYRSFSTGIGTIDTLLPIWRGQRLALLAEPGVGKTSLLRQLATQSSADVNVIALIGERGIEVSQFVEQLKISGSLENTVIIISTSDEPPLRRAFAAYVAVAVAEYLAASDRSVLLLMDSATRLARAFREVGLASGEVPVRRGYPASVFRRLPELIERTGPQPLGSITAFFSILRSGTIDEDPIAEEICSLTDGHIILAKHLAEAGVFPAIDILASLSRNSERAVSKETSEKIRSIRSALSAAADEEDLIRMGGHPLDPNTLKVIKNRSLVSQLLSSYSSVEGKDSKEQLLSTLTELICG